MVLGDLETASRLNLDFTVIVVNNAAEQHPQDSIEKISVPEIRAIGSHCTGSLTSSLRRAGNAVSRTRTPPTASMAAMR